MSGAGAPVPFDELDPFNPNRVRGLVVKSRRRRGDLQITHVNGEACEQYVHATPAIAPLPNGALDFERAHVFEKLDGTNILLYRYRDARGGEYVSYKTRASPFLRLQPYGDFVALWREILAQYATAIAELSAAPFSFGFELFGRRLRILTDYPTGLDARLLYALDRETGRVLAPALTARFAFPMPRRLAEYPAGAPRTVLHGEVLALCRGQARLEGAVVYLEQADRWAMYKLKPPSVEERQARYRELYAIGKARQKAGAERTAVLDAVTAHVARGWSAETRAAQQRVIALVQEDLAAELDFDEVREAKRAARPSPLDASSRILWRTVWGSQIWGMATPTSDRDGCVVYQVGSRLLARAAAQPSLLEPHLTGWRGRTEAGDEHQYELGRAVELLLRGSVTLLLGVMSPIVLEAHETALAELRRLLEESPSKVFLGALLRDTRDSERAMARASDDRGYLKHLRIAGRNLRFGITLLTHGRYEFAASAITQRAELEELRAELLEAARASRLPAQFDRRAFEAYVTRWRLARQREDGTC